ncbi:MAG: dTMP kinase, partial [Paracoccaceae bacterium]
RALVLQVSPDRWSAETEILLFTAARRDHLEQTIQPALDAGKVVVCDRFADSTRLYQGITRGELRNVVDQLHTMMIGKEPDLTFIIDMDPATGLARALSRNTTEERFEGFGEELQAKMRVGFLELAQEFSDRCVVVDGSRDISVVADEVEALALARLA